MHPREVAIIGGLLLFVLVPWVVTRDVWRHPVERYEAAGRSRIRATLLVVLLPLFGPVIYMRHIRPTVRPVKPARR